MSGDLSNGIDIAHTQRFDSIPKIELKQFGIESTLTQIPSELGDESERLDPGEFEVFRNTQIGLLKSKLVIEPILSQPLVAMSSLLAGRADRALTIDRDPFGVLFHRLCAQLDIERLRSRSIGRRIPRTSGVTPSS